MATTQMPARTMRDPHAAPAARRSVRARLGWRVLRMIVALPVLVALPLAAGAAGSPPTANAAAAGSLDPASLLARIAAARSVRVRFVEHKHLKLLDAPVVSSGTLRYDPPGRLEKRTESPHAETMVLQDDRLILERDGRTRSIGVDQLPAVGALVGGLRDVLAGDAGALGTRFRLVAQGTDAAWQLVLLPSDPELGALVSRILIEGGGARVARIEVLQADGDRSSMRLAY